MDFNQKYKNAYNKFEQINEYRKTMKKASDDFKGAYNFSVNKNPDTYRRLTEIINSYANGTTIGRLLTQVYAPHFQALNDAIAAAFFADSDSISKQFKELKNLLKDFNKNIEDSPIYRLDSSLCEGPFSYLARLQMQNPKVDFQELTAFVNATVEFVQWVIKNLDDVFFRWVPILDNTAKIEAQSLSKAHANIDNARNVFAKFTAVIDMNSLANEIYGAGDRLDDLAKTTKYNLENKFLSNRNKWALWLSVPTREWKDYNIIESVKKVLSSSK